MPLPSKPATHRPGNVLALLAEARATLALAVDVKEVKEIRDKAQALRDYVKQQGECLEIQNAAAEIKIRAERRAGELLAEREPKPAGRPPQNTSHDVTYSPPSLDDLGISRKESSRWQQSASIPEPAFEQHIEETKAARKELTSASVQRLAKQDAPIPDPKQLTVDEAVSDLIDRLQIVWERWPKESIRVLGIKLIDLGQEVLDTGEIPS